MTVLAIQRNRIEKLPLRMFDRVRYWFGVDVLFGASLTSRMEQLVNLTWFSANGNLLKHVPSGISQLKKLDSLYLRENPSLPQVCSVDVYESFERVQKAIAAMGEYSRPIEMEFDQMKRSVVVFLGIGTRRKNTIMSRNMIGRDVVRIIGAMVWYARRGPL